MRLSRLHINGFKSFPDRSELGFDHGVTAIVGPNGCGKSNVVDAITWVLGEQSAKSLRGERMEDVIFNGSDARRPTAAAEVRLKLTNVAQPPRADVLDVIEDDSPLMTRDIEIGRRLYRSGESEYLIDGEVCRLRDVHDLLMDSGLGVKAYAVIEQGKIGQILSSRPAERRMLIEEAAGVTKYKSRRHAAELKLAAAQQNLTRIDDIIFEVDKQRNALKRQAARARRYKRLREELRRWEQVQLAHRYELLSREIETADERLRDSRAREASAAAHLAELEALLETLRLQLTEAESSATGTRERAHAIELEIGRRQQQIQFETQQIEELARQAESFDGEARDLEARREPARRAVDEQRVAAVAARHALETANARVEDAEKKYREAVDEAQRAEQDADETRAAVLGAGTALAALRQARENATAVRDRVAAERSKLDVELRELTAEIERTHRQHEAGATALADRERANADVIRQREVAEGKAATDRLARDEASRTLGSQQRDLASKEARRRSLEELQVSRATFGDAAKFLLSQSLVHGAVADYLDVERSYERTVDALLGDLLRHVLVDRLANVATALDALARQNLGRCGFVVLDRTSDRNQAGAQSSAPGARHLRSVVRPRGPYADVLTTLLPDALIVDGLENARRLAAETGVTVATLNGEVCRGAAIVEAGSRSDVRGILEIRGETTQLGEEIVELERSVESLAHTLANRDMAIAAAESAIAALVAAQHDHEKEIVAIKGQVNRAADDLARVTRRADVVTTERRRAEEEERTAEERRDSASAAIAAHEAKQATAEGRLGGVLDGLQRARELAETAMRGVTEARTEQATFAERASGLDMEATRLEEIARDLDERITNRRSDIERTTVRRGELRASIADAEKRLDEGVRMLEDFRTETRTIDERLTGLRSDFTNREHEIRTSRHTLESIRAQVAQSEVAHARASSDLDHLENTCRESVNATLDEVVAAVAEMEQAGELAGPSARYAEAMEEEEEEAEPTAAAEAQPVAMPEPAPQAAPRVFSPENVIADLKRKIERLGPVNMMAIEQFDELEQRHTFLSTQRKDLLDSISQTTEAIRKIDKTTRERFEEAFARINEHFQGTFTTLFGGGRAGLVLIDQENDAESGIDIIAQPPGKRLQNVQLLSGGEKALTAMSLMFAIFKYRPSPFCLLDEIDAPLDDANIGRFVEMLQGMQAHTQFILITHNRKTMEIADRLYGVTMEEPGVSKLISLQLN